jgi:hypothetical protein
MGRLCSSIGEMKTVYKIENLKGREHLEDINIDGRIILE